MKEKLYTIPLNDAINANDECPFCYIERKVEQNLLDFVLGSSSSYMESDVREATDKAGFCRMHFGKMYTYGNTLGNAWILKTHYQKIQQELSGEFQKYQPSKNGFLSMRKEPSERKNSIGLWASKRKESCYICNRFEDEYSRYLDTFFELYQKDTEFQKKVLSSKGFCLPHFGTLCDTAETQISSKEKAQFFSEMFVLMDTNMKRMSKDVNWLVEKFDYRNKDADWRNSKDAIGRGMQKLSGGYPADPDYQAKK